MSKKVIDELFGWEGQLEKYGSFHIWNATPFCLMGRIWREGDNRTFGAVELSITELKSSCLRLLFERSCAFGINSMISFVNFTASVIVTRIPS
jgi:hypothetical protein